MTNPIPAIIQNRLRFKRHLFVGILAFVACVSILIGMIMASEVLDNTLVPGCETTNGTIMQFGVYDYVPKIYEKWINVSYSYCVENITFEQNLFFGQVSRSSVQYYKDFYAPVGRIVTVAYLRANISDSYVGGCPSYYGWAMILKTLFGIGVFTLFCALYAVFLHYCADEKNENVPLNP